MKKLIVCLLSFLLSLPANALTINLGGLLKVNSYKVLTLAGIVDPGMTQSARLQLLATKALPGPRIVVIDSPGGMVNEGIKIIKLLKEEQIASKQPIICVGTEMTHSMAFNIMTQCDVRYMTPDTVAVAHKIAIGSLEGMPRPTAKNLKKVADALEEEDEYWAEQNANALGLTLNEYDKYADNDYQWSAKELLARHYIKAIVTISP